MKNNKKINISKDALEDFIWMSYRYCVGRGSIAAGYHPQTIADVIINNPDLLTEERLKFMSSDIRNEVMTQLKWKDCIDENGWIRNRNWDFFTECLCHKDVSSDFKNKYFYVNHEDGTISVEDKELKYTLDSDYHDLVPWIKLANFLDKETYKKVTVQYIKNDELVTETKVCYSYPAKIDGKYIKVWTDVNNFSVIQSYIIPEYIINIE